MKRHLVCIGFAGMLLLCPASLLAKAPKNKQAAALEYIDFLNQGRTPARLVRFTLDHSKWRRIDPARDEVIETKAGDRLVFVNQDRTAIFVIVGRDKLHRHGARLIASHIDTPSPKLLLGKLKAGEQSTLKANNHGGAKRHHWENRPVGIVGEVVTKKGERKDIALGLAADDFAFFIEGGGKGDYQVVASSTPSKKSKNWTPQTFVGTLFERYGIDAGDLQSAELYVVPRMRARLAGLDESMVGSHGQDDRVNSYAAWRAISRVQGVPKQTSMAWLLDREEVGSTGRTGAQSHFLELVYGYLLRAEGARTGERELLRAFAASTAVSADTPACVNPNWSEVHELQHGPVLGQGLGLFPFTGRGGKLGGSGAHAELIAKLHQRLRGAGVPIQTSELGRVDEGGGGTVAKYLGRRGIDTVDIGVCVIGMHSPHELSSVQDIWWAILGFTAWYTAP